jgi:hypothetical protein
VIQLAFWGWFVGLSVEASSATWRSKSFHDMEDSTAGAPFLPDWAMDIAGRASVTRPKRVARRRKPARANVRSTWMADDMV